MSLIEILSSVKVYRTGKTHSGYKYFEVDINSLGNPEPLGSHFIYHCPWCTDDRQDKKLYYNYRTGVGFCFRCETVVISKFIDIRKVDINKFSWLNFLSSNSYLDISWTETALLSPEVKIYLSKRKYFYENDTIEQFNLRYFRGTDNEIILLLPNNHPTKLSVDSFQTSIISGNRTGPKYVTYSDNKIIYFLNQSRVSSILLVEGIFDAISIIKSSNEELLACPLLGKSVSKSQQRQLYNFMKLGHLKEVFVVLDGEVERHRKIKTCKQILSINSSLKLYYVDLPSELDPEESVAEGIFFNNLNQARRVLS